MGDRLEHDHLFAMQLFERCGIRIPETHFFPTCGKAADFVREHPVPWTIKHNGNAPKASCYVGEMPDGRDVVDILDALAEPCREGEAPSEPKYFSFSKSVRTEPHPPGMKLLRLGAVVGGGIMALASLVICLLPLWFYDWSKRDWLGIEAVKELREPSEAKGLRKLFARALRAGDVPAFFALSIYTDPFITTAYMRKSAFDGMTRRDWGIFLGSWVIGNGEWILVLSSGIWIVRVALGYFL